MALWLMREWLISRSRSGSSAYQITKENLIAKFVGLLNVSRRTVREYLGDLEPFMDVYLEKGRKYFITFKRAHTRLCRAGIRRTMNSETTRLQSPAGETGSRMRTGRKRKKSVPS